MIRSHGFRWGLVVLGCLAYLGGPAAARPGTPAPGAPTSPSLDDLLPYKSPEAMLRALQAIETRRDRAAIPALIGPAPVPVAPGLGPGGRGGEE